jgi:membrane protein DedA with SNARE-associated domain
MWSIAKDVPLAAAAKTPKNSTAPPLALASTDAAFSAPAANAAIIPVGTRPRDRMDRGGDRVRAMASSLLTFHRMDTIAAQLAHHGLGLVFGNVLLHQLGIPIPAGPTLVVAGSLAAKSLISQTGLVAVTVAAATIADVSWFLLGRRWGPRVLRLVRNRTGSAEGLGRRASGVFARWGLKSLLVAKFLPGISHVVVPMSGATGISFGSFLLYDVLGTCIWTAVTIGSGMIFHEQVDNVLVATSQLGVWLLISLAVVATGLIAWRRATRNVAASIPLEPAPSPAWVQGNSP